MCDGAGTTAQELVEEARPAMGCGCGEKTGKGWVLLRTHQVSDKVDKEGTQCGGMTHRREKKDAGGTKWGSGGDGDLESHGANKTEKQIGTQGLGDTEREEMEQGVGGIRDRMNEGEEQSPRFTGWSHSSCVHTERTGGERHRPKEEGDRGGGRR